MQVDTAPNRYFASDKLRQMISPNSSAALSAVRQFILWGMSLLAGSTVLTHGFQLLGGTFHAYSWTLAVYTGALSVIFLVPQIRGESYELTSEDLQALAGLAALCLAGVLIAALSYRPDFDDYYYAPNAVYYLQHPRAAMGFEVHFIKSQTQITSLFWGTSLPYEYARAAFAYVTGLNFLSVYYFVTSGMVGGLIPLAYFYLLSQFTDNSLKSIFGTFVALSILLFMTDKHRTPGNFAFVRAFQGKALMLSAGIPLLAGATIEFFQRRSIQMWILLFVTTTGLVGASTSAAVILPALGSVVGLTLLLQQENWREIIGYSISYGLSYVYIFSYTAFILVFSNNGVGVKSPVNEGWPTTFWGHAELMVNTSRPFTPFVFLVGTITSIFYLDKNKKKIFATWAILCLTFYLNPVVDNILINNITSPNIYWRMVYIYPFVVLLGVVGFLGFDWLQTYSQKMKNGILIGMITVIVAVYIPFQSELQWFPLQYPIQGNYDTASRIVEEIPRGAMLAPHSLSGPIAMISSEHPQMRVRSNGVLLWLGQQQAHRRIDASSYAGGNGGSLRDFEKVIQKSTVCSVVVSERVSDDSQVRSTLSSAGYTTGPEIGDYVAYSRPSKHYDACKSAGGRYRPTE